MSLSLVQIVASIVDKPFVFDVVRVNVRFQTQPTSIGERKTILPQHQIFQGVIQLRL